MARRGLHTKVIRLSRFNCIVHRPATAGPQRLVLFLHGAGERGHRDGRDIQRVLRHGPWHAEDAAEWLIVAPQCETDHTWSAIAGRVATLAREVMSKWSVGVAVLAGLSMGAFGAWSTATNAPDLFDAIISICGGYAPEMPRGTHLRQIVALSRESPPKGPLLTLRNSRIAAWIFHGERDERIDPGASRLLYSRLGGRGRGGRQLRLTMYESLAHSCWGRAFRTPGLLRWAASTVEADAADGCVRKRRRLA